MQQSYFVHTQQKDDSCEHHWMCIEDLLGGLDHVQCIQTISGRITTHSCLHSLLQNTPEIYFRKHISVMLVYELTGLGDIFWWILRQLCRETMVTVFSSTLHQCFQRQPTEHMDRVSSGPYENPGMWILKSTQSNLSHFRDVEHFPSFKKQHFYGDTQCVTSSGNHAEKLWPWAISWIKINLVSQSMPPK